MPVDTHAPICTGRLGNGIGLCNYMRRFYSLAVELQEAFLQLGCWIT